MNSIINLRIIAIPEEIKKKAYDRARSQCQIPNCPVRQNLEIHHLDGNRLNNDLKYNLCNAPH